MKNCSRCGNGYPEPFQFCPVDGGELGDDDGGTPPEPRDGTSISLRTLVRALLVLVGVAFLAFAGVFLYYYLKPKYGGMVVKTTPPGANVVLDGKPRGVTPLTIDELAAGRHTIEFKSGAGTVQRTITVAANTVTEIEESIFSGFVAIFAPFELVISEGPRTLSLDERNQLMLPPGRHELRLTNRALEFETVRQVDLKPGETVTLSIAPPMSTMTVTASEPAEVWLDGARIGDAPVNEAPLTLGTHDIVVKRAAGGEKRYTLKVTAKPLTLNVQF